MNRQTELEQLKQICEYHRDLRTTSPYSRNRWNTMIDLINKELDSLAESNDALQKATEWLEEEWNTYTLLAKDYKAFIETVEHCQVLLDTLKRYKKIKAARKRAAEMKPADSQGTEQPAIIKMYGESKVPTVSYLDTKISSRIND